MTAAGRDPDRALFADELRAMRKRAGLSRDDLGGQVGYSGALIGMVEAMHRAPTRDLAGRLDETFALPGTFTRMEERLRGVPFAASFRPFQPYEAEARSLRTFEHSLIPGLLQTPDYARALAEGNPGLADDDARDRMVEATLARQKAVFGERRPDVHLIIGQAALHQEVGGRAVMEAQLGLLAGVSGDSGLITVQILPFSSGAHAAAGIGSLAILQFAHAPGLGVVYLDGARGGVCLESQPDLSAYLRAFEQLKAFALSPAQSALMLRSQTAA